MPVEIYALGGYGEVGKNMTAIRVDDETVICDMGIHLPNYIAFTEGEREDIKKLSANELKKAGAIPNDDIIKDLKKEVKAIVVSHAHLDHIGAVPFLANKYKSPIYCTPFASEVLRTILKDEKLKLKNEIKILNENSMIKISEKISIEFVKVTHSTPQTVIVVIHTPYGKIVYSPCFKFDDFPVLGKKPNYKRLQELGKEKVIALIIDCLYSDDAKKMPGEEVVRDMLKEIILGENFEKNALIITTFSSHLARLKSILEFCKKLNRKILFLGRSLSKYTEAGERIGLIDFSKDSEVIKFSRNVKRKLKQVMKEGAEKYILIITGHQGEPKSVLSRIVRDEFSFKLKEGDGIIFSCTIIPTESNIKNRAELEKKLKEKKIRIYKDVHVSGHAAKEDLRDLINFIKAKHLIPVHGELRGMDAFKDLAKEVGYKDKDIHLMRVGEKLLL